jgi:hypothetical protein
MSINSRYIYFSLAVIAGIGLGLLYGWVISPVELVETSPATLRIDFKTDYILMVSEIYHLDHEAEEAVCHLALLGGDPRQHMQQALAFANEVQYLPNDIQMMNDLAEVLNSWEPKLEVCP